MQRVKLFIIYARKDEHLKEEMENHLQPLIESGEIEMWHDQELKPGEKWEKIIIDKISQADIIVPLVSSDFFASKYIHGTEMRIAFDRYSKNECIRS